MTAWGNAPRIDDRNVPTALKERHNHRATRSIPRTFISKRSVPRIPSVTTRYQSSITAGNDTDRLVAARSSRNKACNKMSLIVTDS